MEGRFFYIQASGVRDAAFSRVAETWPEGRIPVLRAGRPRSGTEWL